MPSLGLLNNFIKSISKTFNSKTESEYMGVTLPIEIE